MGRHVERGAELPAKPPRKYTQGQTISRDGPPLGDVVASTLIFRISPQGALEIIGVEDHDPRKSRGRFVKGAHLPFCLCLPGGRQQTNMKSGEKETPHFVARKEAQEEAGIALPFKELFPVLTVRRVGWGKSGRDHFDKERLDGQVIHFDHFIFACYGEKIVPGTPREHNIKNPAWYPIETVLDNPRWSFDHVTLIIATLKTLGDLCERWIHGEWTPDTSRDTEKEGEALGTLFFERFAAPLRESSSALDTMIRYTKTDLLWSVAKRMKGDTHPDREESAEWYFGIKKKQGMEKVVKLEAEIDFLRSEIDRIKSLISRIGTTPGMTLEEAERETAQQQSALTVKELKLQVKEAELGRKKQEHPGRFVADSFRSIMSREAYGEVLRAIEEEQGQHS